MDEPNGAADTTDERFAHVRETADRAFQCVLAELRFLPELEEDQRENGVDDSDDAYAYYWMSEVMDDALLYLEGASARGELTDEQQARYRELKAALKAELPRIERLGLMAPPVALDG